MQGAAQPCESLCPHSGSLDSQPREARPSCNSRPNVAQAGRCPARARRTGAPHSRSCDIPPGLRAPTMPPAPLTRHSSPCSHLALALLQQPWPLLAAPPHHPPVPQRQCLQATSTHLVLVLLQQPVGPQQRVAQPLHAVHALAAGRRAGWARPEGSQSALIGRQPAAASAPCPARSLVLPEPGRPASSRHEPAPGGCRLSPTSHLSSSFSPLCLNSRRKSSMSWLQAHSVGEKRARAQRTLSVCTAHSGSFAHSLGTPPSIPGAPQALEPLEPPPPPAACAPARPPALCVGVGREELGGQGAVEEGDAVADVGLRGGRVGGWREGRLVCRRPRPAHSTSAACCPPPRRRQRPRACCAPAA